MTKRDDIETVKGTCELTVMVADTFYLRLRGLLGRDVDELGGLLIKPCNQVHTCFMGYPIDVVYLDGSDVVLRIDEAVPPWRFCRAERRAKTVVELPAHQAVVQGIKVGSRCTCASRGASAQAYYA